MHRSLLTLLCFFGFSALGLAQQIQVLDRMPMPTQPVAQHVLRNLAEGDIWTEDAADYWLELRPEAGLSEYDAWQYESYATQRAEALARLNDWDQGQRDAWLEAAIPAPVELTYSVEREGGQVLLRGVEGMAHGRPAALGLRTQHPVVIGFSGQIAAQATIAAPVVGSIFEGTALQAVIYPIPGRGWWVEYALTSNKAMPTEAIQTGSAGIDGKARIRQQILEWGGSVVLEPGKPVQMSMMDPQGGQLRMTLQVDQAAPTGRTPAGRFVALDVPTLNLDPGMAGVLDEMRGSLAWASPCGLLVIDPDAAGAAADELLLAVAEVPQVTLELRYAQDDQPEQVRSRVQSVAGRSVRFASGQLEDALVSWDLDVANQARLATPQFASLFAGWRGSLTATTQAGEIRSSAIRLRASSLAYGKTRRVQMAAARELGGQGGVLPEESGFIEVPLHSQRSFQADGRRALIRFERGSANAQGKFVPDRLTFQSKALSLVD